MLKMKKIEIMGVEIDNYSVRESLLLADAYLNNHVMNTIEYVKGNAMPISESIASRVLCLPLYVGMVKKEIEKIVSFINKKS